VTDAVKKEKPEVGEWVKLNAAEFKGVKLHTISIPIPENVPERAKHVSMIGEKLEIVIGTGKQSVYVAVGRDPLKAIKDVIESSAGSTSTGTLPPVEISVSLDSIAQFVAAVGEDQAKPMAAALAEELKASPGRDHLTFVAHPVPQGVTYRLELEEGALKALVKVAAKTLHR
jgi:hypothetical protein